MFVIIKVDFFWQVGDLVEVIVLYWEGYEQDVDDFMNMYNMVCVYVLFNNWDLVFYFLE